MTRVAVPGCAGRMGRALVQALAEADDLQLCAASEAPGSSALGVDAGTLAGLPPLGVIVTDDPDQLLARAESVIDFTAPAASLAMAARCVARGLPLVLGTTGLSAADRQQLAEAVRMAGSSGKKVHDEVVRLGYAPGEKVMKALAKAHRLKFVQRYSNACDLLTLLALRLKAPLPRLAIH